jgi:predicted aldo/keto reductase-like oxidoreductase
MDTQNTSQANSLDLNKLKKLLNRRQAVFSNTYNVDPSKVSRVLNGKVYDPNLIEKLVDFAEEEAKRQEGERRIVEKLAKRISKID